MFDDDDLIGFEEQERKRKPGRPRGAKTRSEVSKVTEERVDAAYKRLSPMLTKEQRHYLEEMRAGKCAFDGLRSLEIMLRQVEIIFAEVSETVLSSKIATKEFGELINAFRMGIKDHEDIRRARLKDAQTTQSDEADRLKERERAKRQLDELFASSGVED